MRFTLRGARLVDAATDLPAGDITVERGRIVAVGAPAAEPGRIVEAAGAVVVPGFIDVHTHGGGGCNLQTTDPEEIGRYARWAPATGVTAFLVTVVGTPGALPEPQLRAATAAIERARDGAEPVGIFMEGPYISERRRGAHAPGWLRPPDAAETERILELAAGRLRLMTVAPELPGAGALIRRLVEAGVVVSIGHTDATYEQALDAIARGVTHATHCYNAMRPLGHRDPGPLAAIARSPQVRGEVIADGVHVHPAMLALLTTLLGPERTVVVTDAQAVAGADGGSFDFAGQPVHVERGAARLADGTLTGSVLTMDRALRNVLAMSGVGLREAVGMVTRNPARAARVDDRKGALAVGYDADLAILDEELRLCATLRGGSPAYADGAWRERLAPLRRSGLARTRAEVGARERTADEPDGG